ncbi:MAG TPA: DNA/RNA non-specific endonuclease [Kofleriaceae bacterium]|nr:DNA/RNA non-specific endonuclease [Kofleriaceae bacterium]
MALPLACLAVVGACGRDTNTPGAVPPDASQGGGPIDGGRSDGGGAPIDGGGGPIDGGGAPIDGGPGGGIDAPPPPVVTDDGSIASAVNAADGDGLALAIHGAVVTYLKDGIGNLTSDPAGFTIQASRTGAALMIAVDPASLTPPLAIGDVVDFTITSKHTVAGQPRATAIAQLARTATGADVGALTQELSAATDLVTAIDHYDSELVTITGTITADFGAGGPGFVLSNTIATAGITGVRNLQLRVPATTSAAIDLVKPCQFTVTRVPMGRFNAQAQIAPFRPGDFALRGCPAPAITDVAAPSATMVAITFSRHIAPASVRADGSQFTFSNGLVATAARVDGQIVTLTTSRQIGQAAYTVSVAETLTDLQGSPVGNTGAFAGFGPAGGGPGAALSVHTTLGIPGPITTASPSDQFLYVNPYYVESYNASRKVPNWVSWELNTSYLGAADRQNDYRPNDNFPLSEPQASLADYSGSGFERGHMCPSADRTLTPAINSQTFFLTNMVPQSANNNEGPWADLESYTRGLVQGGHEAFVISGGTFTASSKVVGAGLVVPDATWKVIVLLNAVGDGPAQVSTSTRVIAVLMPNDNVRIQKGDDWHNFRVSVDTLEAMTGLDFLSDVAPSVQAVVEARVDNLP